MPRKSTRRSVGTERNSVPEAPQDSKTGRTRHAKDKPGGIPALVARDLPSVTIDAVLDVAVPTQETDPAAKSPIRVEVDATFLQSAVLRQAVAENLAPLHDKIARTSLLVNTAFADWRPVRLSEAEQARGLYVPPEADASATVKAAIEAGVDVIRDANSSATIRLRNTRELKDITKDITKPARQREDGVRGEVQLGPLIELLYSKRSATSLVSNPIYTSCKAEFEAEEILKQVTQTLGEDGPDDDEEPQDLVDLTAAQYVEDAVHRQMDPATAPETRLAYDNKIPNSSGKDEVQRELLKTFVLRPGPSDVTSYHDFHTLQIAFANVWTKLFNGEIERLGRELYRRYVDLKDFTGSKDPDLKVSTTDDLRRLIDEIKKLSQFVDDELPSALRPEGSQAPTAGGLPITPENVARGGVALATGGASVFIEWAFNELVKLGNRPQRVQWNSFPLLLNPGRGNIIELLPPEPNAVYPSQVEIVLETDANSFKKQLVFQQWDTDTRGPIFTANAQNWPPPITKSTLRVNTAQVASGTIKFFSEDEVISEVLLGRYVLGNLAEVLTDRTRVTFRWKGQR